MAEMISFKDMTMTTEEWMKNHPDYEPFKEPTVDEEFESFRKRHPELSADELEKIRQEMIESRKESEESIKRLAEAFNNRRKSVFGYQD